MCWESTRPIMFIKPLIITLLASTVVLIPTNKDMGGHPATINQFSPSRNMVSKLPEPSVSLQATLASKTITKPVEPPKQAPVASAGSCDSWKAQAGIPNTHATNTLINNESGCQWWVINPKSGACGIPQAYPCSKLPCPLTEAGAVCQLNWMKNYVAERYGSWESALSFWYAQCSTPSGCWY